LHSPVNYYGVKKFLCFLENLKNTSAFLFAFKILQKQNCLRLVCYAAVFLLVVDAIQCVTCL